MSTQSPVDGELKKEQKSKIPVEEADQLVVEHRGWAESIARSVARAWSLDWQLDGLDGAAMEALIFCSRRFDPSMGVPFKGYARRRIHEASTEAARKCKNWHRGLSDSAASQKARELSSELLDIYPELRGGEISVADESTGGDDDLRGSIRQLLISATVLAAKETSVSSPEDAVDYKRMIRYLARLEDVHQWIIYKMYWEGTSMRGVASEWEMDELNIIREHKLLMTWMQKSIERGATDVALKVRPGLKTIAMKLKRQKELPPFSEIVKRSDR